MVDRMDLIVWYVQYNDPAALEEAKEESGWKLVHGDVFRAPITYPMLLRYRIVLH